ncbi:enoyl-CoA hydratase/isomerase family protein [Brevibacterium sp. 91QC2O2]|uniref:enoyl-CoA hydratase/isomerase family protein n=1 Tax=Brevibacterium TaxID=1696 RepID=UPI00211D1359|nr:MULTISPECIES: enoyl-CoA hydratase/isomerase family protein [unclassified Brevibacterium]MCQ9369407.1 enoyl-CoA hydratase/isomerase family protein [Brevibacterium sp. 91QC2O2]MCQ9387017.1 enoyl-CoA hydratase/isomerase family protein [Brevibacterium sp. 68QC2CO]
MSALSSHENDPTGQAMRAHPPLHDITIEDRTPATRVITIQRPHVRNAYRSRTAQELAEAITEFGINESLRSLIITGGDTAFCAGGDLKSAEEYSTGHNDQLGHATVVRNGMHGAIRALQACDKPTIAQISGACTAGGLALALACDLRIADTTATFGDPASKVGLLPDEGGAWLFSRVMGADQALLMMLTGITYSATEAANRGLVTSVVEPNELQSTVFALCESIASTAPITTRLLTRLVHSATDQTLDQALQTAELACQIANNTRDADEGLAAFKQHRVPEYEGK